MCCRRSELVRLTDHKVIERVSITELCVDAALFLALFWRYCRRRHEQIHLITGLSLFMHAEDDRQWMAKRNWS